MAVAAQAELIMDDPRDESKGGIWADVKEFVQASKECQGLLTMGQAGKILGVGSNQISVWVARGRIKSKFVLGVKMLSASEVLALYRERQTEIRSGGHKAPSLAELASSAWQDIDPLK